MILITFILLYLLISIYFNKDKMKLYCIATILWTSFCYSINEFLSLFRRLDANNLFCIYLIVDIVLCVLLWLSFRNKKVLEIDKTYKMLLKLKSREKEGILFIVFFIVMFGLALFTVPYNWDSMTYHLPRVVEWAQNKSVAHYATYDVRRLTSPVLPAFVNLHVYLMNSNSDSIFNLLQYSSYVTNAVLVFHICKKLSLEKKFCYFGMLLFVSMPIAFGEALSTQVDHFSTMWLLMFVYILLDLLSPNYKLLCNKKTFFDVILLSSCIGYGYLAKPSVMFGMVFFAVWLLIVCINRKDKLKDVLILILIAAVIIIVITAPEVMRNIITFGSISDPIAGKRQLIGTLHPFYVIVNGLMNYTMNLPNIYINWGDILEYGVYCVAYVLGVDIRSPLIAEDGVEFFLHEAARYNHDTAINPTVVIVATIVFVWVLWKIIKKQKLQFQDKYIVVSVSSFLFFCCILRWEPFVTRYMLSYLALMCPVVAIWLDGMKRKEYSNAILGILVFISLCELMGLFSYHLNICREQKSHDDRTAGYFTFNGGNAANYIKLKEELQELECDNIGLYLSMAATYEYPIWTMVDEDVHMESILVDNVTTRYVNEEFIPEYIIVINKDANDIRNYKMQKYSCYKEINTNFSIWKLEK